MKNLKYFLASCMALAAFTFTACSDDDSSSSAEMTIDKVFLEDVKSTVPDREVTFARLGQLLRIQGSGFTGLKYIYINGYQTYFNNALMTDNNVWVTVNSKTPVYDAEESERNTIRFVKDNTETVYSFEIRSAAASMSSISNTLPQPGETVIVYGSNLQETSQVTLPSGTIITDITSDDEDGEWYSFVMPEGETVGGSITSVGTNGTVITPEYFNNRNTIILDFDGTGTQGYWSWSETGSMINADDLVDDPLSSGRGTVCQIIPQRLIDNGGIAASKSRASEVWTAGNGNDADDWTWMTSYYDASTVLDSLAFQFDIYCPDEWNGTGQIQITLQNNISFNGYGSDEASGSSTQTYVWVPWLNEDGTTTAFQTDGWRTVTIPLSYFSKYANEKEDDQTPTFQEVIDDRNNSSYKNFGMGFVNTDFTYNEKEYASSVCSLLIYVDNFRIVPIKTFSVSDFDD